MTYKDDGLLFNLASTITVSIIITIGEEGGGTGLLWPGLIPAKEEVGNSLQCQLGLVGDR